MDPVTVLGLVASIVQLINGISRVIKYAGEVRNAPNEREAVSLEAANLISLLMALKQRAEADSCKASWFSSVRSLGMPQGPIPQLYEAVEQLGTRLKLRKKMINDYLMWPSDRKECVIILARIERLKSLIGLTLNDDLL